MVWANRSLPIHACVDQLLLAFESFVIDGYTSRPAWLGSPKLEGDLWGLWRFGRHPESDFGLRRLSNYLLGFFKALIEVVLT